MTANTLTRRIVVGYDGSPAEIIIGTRGFGRARALLGSVTHELIHWPNAPSRSSPSAPSSA